MAIESLCFTQSCGNPDGTFANALCFLGAWLAWQIEPALMPYMLVHALSFATVALWDVRDQLVSAIDSSRRLVIPHRHKADN